jgi:septum site-determining protein MinD
MLAIVGGKGGCGKTTTALGIGRAYATAGERPLVVDADCDMPNLHTMAETAHDPGLDALAGGVSLDVASHRSEAVPGVTAVPAGTATAPDERALRRVARWPGPALVDCPAGATEDVATPLRVADHALVVSTPTPASCEDAAKTARMARALGADIVGAVLTRTTVDLPANREAVEPLRSECRVIASVPEVDAAGADVLADPVGRSAYERIVTRLSERNI